MESERFYLREFQESDWKDVHEYAAQAVVSQYQPWGPNSVEESRAFVNDVLTDAKKDPRTRFVFAIELKESGKVIGAGEINVRDAANKAGEIGYILNPAFWGQGFATETAKLLLQYGFSELNLHRIYAKCDPRNTASQTVLEKIGMLKEGMMRENLLLKEGWRDSLLYSVLEQEWREQPVKGRKEIQKLRLWHNEMNEEFAKEILNWKYAEPYNFYNNDVTEEELQELLDGSYSALVSESGKLIGFFCTGSAAQVPIGKKVGAYNEYCIDIGLGMNPELTGNGHGSSFFSKILELVDEKKNDLPLRLTVAAFNERAIHLYEKSGFKKESEFSTSSTKFITMVQEER